MNTLPTFDVQPGAVIVVWFSCGAASAVAAKETVERYGATCDVRIVNNPVVEEDADNRRFLRDVEAWLERPIAIATSSRRPSGSAVEVWKERRYMVNAHGYAPCTEQLKKWARFEYEAAHNIDFHVLGFTADETRRYERFTAYERANTLPVLIEANITKQDCFIRLAEAGIELPAVYRAGMPNANCFSGDTEFITDMGVRRLKDAVGESVRVRGGGKGSGWKEATVQAFGVQRLSRLTVRRNNVDREIYTTANHRWFVKGKGHTPNIERVTNELKPGDRLASSFGQIASRTRPSAFAIAQGIVFGDGSRDSTSNAAAQVTLCGEKQELLRYFPLSPTRPSTDGIEVKDLPRQWKDKPSLDECQSFLYGWLAGYFAADGCVASGEYVLSSAYLKNILFARDVAVRLGIGTNPIRVASRVGFEGREPSNLYSLPLIGDTLREDFFLRAPHRERFLSKPSREPHPWTVVSVEPTDRIEEVFCAVVPDGAAFTLEGNILTGNCIGCVKATSPTYWNLVRTAYPVVFKERADQSRELGARLVRHKGQRIFLDELPNDARGGDLRTMENECGIFCMNFDSKGELLKD